MNTHNDLYEFFNNIHGINGNKRSDGYYVKRGSDKHHLILTDKGSPMPFSHLYNIFEVSISVFPKVDAIHVGRNDYDIYSNKLNMLKQFIENICAYFYVFTFDIPRFKHIVNKYGYKLHKTYLSCSSGIKYPIYTINLYGKIIASISKNGFKIYTHKKYKYKYNVVVSQWRRLLHLKNGCKIKTKIYKVKYKIPAPLYDVMKLWSHDLRAEFIQDCMLNRVGLVHLIKGNSHEN